MSQGENGQMKKAHFIIAAEYGKATLFFAGYRSYDSECPKRCVNWVGDESDAQVYKTKKGAEKAASKVELDAVVIEL
jgi:hypothetical protein